MSPNGCLRLRRAATQVTRNLAALLLLASVGQYARAEPLFDAPFWSFDVGYRPSSVAIGDLSGDSRPDLAVANTYSGTVSILLGNGDGTFRPKTDFRTGSGPRSVAIADLNGDSKPDLAVANGSDSTVSILLGNGDGSFRPKTDFETGGRPRCVAIADLNADSKLDLAVANAKDSTISVLLGNGDGAFGPKTDFGTGSNPRSVAIGDLNADSRPDLAVANAKDRTVSILLGNGDGSFGAETEFETGPEPSSVAVADLNADSKLDLAVANAGYATNTVTILLGNGNGIFRPKTDFGTGPGAQSVAIADLNGDSKLDLAVANTGFWAGSVSILLGNGDGTFGPKADFEAGSEPLSVAIADLNGDSRPDLATANDAGSTAAVLLGNGDGSFGPRRTAYATGGNLPSAVAIGELNGDSKPDLAVPNANDGIVSILLGNGDGSLGPYAHFRTGDWPFSWPFAIAIADLNGDSKLDLVVANDLPRVNSTVSILLGNGDGTFGPNTDFRTGSGPQSVAIADLNGDSKLDLAVAGGDGVSILLGNGDGTFGPRTDIVMWGIPHSVAIADLNGDSKLDLAVANAYATTVSILLGKGDGSFGPEAEFEIGEGWWSTAVAVAIGDLNGDSKPDLAVANGSNDYTPDFFPKSVSILLGKGDGTFGSKALFTTGRAPEAVAIADLNGDSKPDLVTANRSSNTVSILLGNGDGTFGLKTDLGTGSSPCAVAIADLNADSRPDLVTANYDNRSVSVLLGRGTVPVAVEDFEAEVSGNRALLSWRLSGSIWPALRGIAVQRADASEGPYSERTPELLPPEAEMSFEDAILEAGREHWYRLVLVSRDGTRSTYGPVLARTTAAHSPALVLAVTRNPARGLASVLVTVPNTGEACVRIYDTRGHLVRELLHGVLHVDTPASITWDGRDNAGKPVASGVYSVRLSTAGRSRVQKLTFVR